MGMMFVTGLLLRVAVVAVALAAGVRGDDLRVVNVPSGVTTVTLDGQVELKVDTWVPPDAPPMFVDLTLTDGNGTNMDALVVPRTLVFTHAANASVPQKLKQKFSLFGRVPGRFYLDYALGGTDVDKFYRLSAERSVVSIAAGREQGWQGIWYQLLFNSLIFLGGTAFFAWRRLQQLDLPVWMGHQEALFERSNYEDMSPDGFTAKYGELQGSTLKERMTKFWRVSCSGDYVSSTCGIPAALILHFYRDCAHLFAFLSFFSLAVMLPVNYVPGSARRQKGGDTYQETTFSNVPLHSEWYWAHVAYCYLVAFAVLSLLRRQHEVASTLRRRAKHIVGARSVFIQHGLPLDTTHNSLLEALRTAMPPEGSVHEITVLRDLSAVHELLQRRKVLSEKLSRVLAFDEAYENGTLSYNLLCCPGSVMAPEPLEVAWWHLRCKPGRYMYRHEKITECCCYCCTCCCPKHSPSRAPKIKRGSRSDSQFETMYESLVDDTAVEAYDRTAARQIFALREELDFFPEDALEEFGKRKCMGAAFVIFDSTATRNAFVRNVRAQTCVGRLTNTAESLSRRGFRERPLASLRKPERFMSEELAPVLRDVVLKSAPEPDDVIWQSLAYRPYTVRRIVVFWLRQIATLSLLLLFSTPTAVLMFIKLDSNSDVYRGFSRRKTFLLTMLASYLPSLLLIAVNWCLLAFLYHLTMSEPSFSHSRRVKSFLVKGFAYLVVSSVILPSIGVTAVYLALSDIEKTGGRSYVESFLYNVSGTFFISYVCQRTFLGGIVDITRCADTMALQPWIHSRSITSAEIQKAVRPSAFSYGHDYALVLSVFLVILLGTVITPIITPFGAIYFYVKFFTTKYNALYVLPYSPGRGHIAGTALELTFVCLIVFEVVMSFVFLQVAGRKQFVAMIVLLAATYAVYFSRLSGKDAFRLVQQGFADLRGEAKVSEYESITIPKPPGSRRSMFGPKPTDLQHEDALIASYADPYKAALSIFKLLGVNKFHQMTSSKTQLRYAFIKLRRWSQRPLPEPETPKKRWWQWGKKMDKKPTKTSGEKILREKGIRGWWRRHQKDKHAEL
ncbi:Transmembrane protein 63C [Phytophthora pseudosyringae]|uniref:Transmembrane protein 63C n=1 Tax=Phytophthora pseudosyringae TaxID=221518 RepID=A0A8T1W3Y5_9STRA|nr:Transmembrane protein 63C [Phytophthora pseudosyringae]